jgi:DNA-binding transcriptional regulator LsrR (DeoR family)
MFTKLHKYLDRGKERQIVRFNIDRGKERQIVRCNIDRGKERQIVRFNIHLRMFTFLLYDQLIAYFSLFFRLSSSTSTH